MRLLPLLLCAAVLAAVEVELRAPLSTQVEVAGAGVLDAVLTVPPDAPRDLGVAAFVCDREGRWWQRTLAAPLRPGRHVFAADLSPAAPLRAEPLPASWGAARRTDRIGVVLWSATASRARIGVELAARPAAMAGSQVPRLGALRLDPLRWRTGERWTLECLPAPLPDEPAQPERFSLDLLVEDPDGRRIEIPCFWREPGRLWDRGDTEVVAPAGAARFAVRYRPLVPGTHRLRLRGVWEGGGRVEADLPDLVVEGAAVDPFVRIDRGDPRFFAVGGAFWWPVGLNLHSTFDQRSREVNGTRLTPARGTQVYEAMLRRLAAAGGDATEVWMSSWNLALEWRGDWPGYGGIGRINLANAERLDRVLDLAWAQGVRVNLVLNNHGQASPRSDREWRDNPWNQERGGPLASAAELFTDARALAGQARIRRYLIGRYADHPALLGWKLYSEVDLTAGTPESLLPWHHQAAEDFRRRDAYGHPVSAHWAGDYRRPEQMTPGVAALPGITYLCIDAYRSVGQGRDVRLLADLLMGSTLDPIRGLARHGKPVLVTEFGASSSNAPEEFREVDHLTGAWAALVSGHAGAPMLWWWEWVDQGGRWGPFGAIRRFVAGEDLRGAAARGVELTCTQGEAPLWARAWVRPGRLLGYLLEPVWGARGGAPPRLDAIRLVIGEQVAAGRIRVAWWDADAGRQTAVEDIDHPGGRLELHPPPCLGHAAFKVTR
jgi:hypothetical protein